MNRDISISTAIESAHAFCETKVANQDLGQYYALLFLPSTHRRAAMALYAFWLELREINDECSDPEIARVKLAWWHEEMRAMYAGQAHHPAAQALAPIIASCALPESEFLPLFTGLEQHIGATAYPTYRALREHGERTRGHVERLSARIAGHTDPELLAHAVKLGSTIELIDILRNTGIDAGRGRVYLPRDELMSCGIDTDDLQAGRLRQSSRGLLTQLANRLHAELARHTQALSAYERMPLLSFRIEIAVAQALLTKVRRRPERVLRTRPRLAPWRLLWIAWRRARREQGLAIP